MEFHQLRYFVAVADEGSFSRAAARERVAQPSLSQQVQKLEFEVGQPLFDRLPRGVVLTRAGEQLLARAKRILAEVADARNALAAGGEPVGVVTVGVIPTIAPFLLPPLAEQFRVRCPRVVLESIEDVTAGLLRRLEIGELDLAVVSTASATPSLRVEFVAAEHLLALAPAGGRLARKARLSWRDLESEPFLVLNEMHCLGAQVSQVCEQRRIDPRVSFRGAHLETVARMVSAGAGVSLVPAMMAATDSRLDRVYRPLRDPQPTRPLNLAWNLHRHQTAPTREAAQVLRELLVALASGSLSSPSCGNNHHAASARGSRGKARPRTKDLEEDRKV